MAATSPARTASSPDVQILVTEKTYAEFGARLRAAEPDVEWVRMQADGGLVVGDRAVTSEDVAPEVAWGTAEMFFDGVQKPFFAFALASPTLRWFQHPGAGIDHPVYGRLLERGIRLSVSHINSVPIAEFVLGMVLGHLLRADEWRAAQAAQEWRHHEFREVIGSTWLVVGLGAIGSEVARRAQAFDATVIGVRRTPRGGEPVDEMLHPDDVLAALPRADVVVIAAPATPETLHLVDARFLAAMRERSVLVNVARGSLVDEDALLAALDRGVPEVAILDVFESEPLPRESPLWAHPRVVVTPHSSSGGLGRHARNIEMYLTNLARYRAGEPLLWEVTAADVASSL
jgi:glyoxylate/hydroxypyruvate reductase A